MRVHVVLDDELLRAAEDACPHPTRRALLEEALRVLIERQAARDLARMVRNREFGLQEVARRRPGGPAGGQGSESPDRKARPKE